MPQGFEYDPTIVRARAMTLRTPRTSAADFGAAWSCRGAAFRVSLAVLAEDLTHLPSTLTAADLAPLRTFPLRAAEANDEPDAAAAAKPASSAGAASSAEAGAETTGSAPEADGKADTSAGEAGAAAKAGAAAEKAEAGAVGEAEAIAPEAAEFSGDSWEIVGGALGGVSAQRRGELRGLHFGRVREDLRRLDAVADALDGQAPLTDYARALRGAVAGLRSALGAAHRRLVAYRATLEAGSAPANATADVTSDVDDLLGSALAGLRAVVAVRPFSAGRQLLALGRQVTVVDGGIDHVTVTIADGAGDPTTYDLDFDAASGQALTPARTRPSARRIPAGTNGKCVFDHPGVTVTVERDLFDAATVILTLDDGRAEPSTHTVAVSPAPVLPRVPEQAAGSDEIAAGGAAGSTAGSTAGSAVGTAAGTGWSVHGDLFDTRDPVHSVHGVLSLDDRPGN
ncbi:hypothetical protein BLA60_38225 [Actinophytocola xinjiangensis]|uniref:Uncharacterized protein n=1 Tax=Actinophytocola xinjiangensis TaxID=485602 RepID=A0A7Z0WDM9_9PSEU|nr:hypothetical protein [Actinophytocola xinjiangensis]OLF04935.1 hypothetical protein BLA60_38225 [Actinophytocola xinjiangensis]